MNHILILTRNILVEQEIQKKLQMLNYEVYCSTVFFEMGSFKERLGRLMDYFSYIVVSETISEVELTILMPWLEAYSGSIIRKVEEKITESEQMYLERGEIDAVISTGDSRDELRECLYMLKGKAINVEDISQISENVELLQSTYLLKKMKKDKDEQRSLSMILGNLSNAERKVLTILSKAEGKIISREELCTEVWGDGVTKSHLASLSSIISRIKEKFARMHLNETAILTSWGKGYSIHPELLDKLNQNDFFLDWFIKQDLLESV